jgi:hypothetical protein
MLEHSSPVLEGPVQRLHFACSGAHFGCPGYTRPRPDFNAPVGSGAGEVAQRPAVEAADHPAGQADHGAVDRVNHRLWRRGLTGGFATRTDEVQLVFRRSP